MKKLIIGLTPLFLVIFVAFVWTGNLESLSNLSLSETIKQTSENTSWFFSEFWRGSTNCWQEFFQNSQPDNFPHGVGVIITLIVVCSATIGSLIWMGCIFGDKEKANEIWSKIWN